MIEIFLAALAGALMLLSALATVKIKRNIKKWRRRKGGVYLVRVDHHRNRARRVNGYVGETVNHYLRQRQHLGVSRFDPATGQAVKTGTVKVASQPWSDLNPVWHTITLPWWLCWKWVLRPLETFVILLTWPVYNDAKNRWNPRRIPKAVAKVQREARDQGQWSIGYRARVTLAHGARIAAQVAGAVLVLIGTYGWIATR